MITNEVQIKAAEFAARITPFITAYAVACVQRGEADFDVEDFASYVIAAQEEILE